MKIKEPVIEGCVVHLEVELDVEELQPHLAEAMQTTRRQAKVPGFRPGKAPEKILRQRFGKEIREDAVEAAIKDYLPGAIKESGVKPINLGPVEDLNELEDGGVRFTAILEIAPELDPYAWRGRTVVREIATVTDEDLQRHIDTMRRDRAVVTDATPDQGAEQNDRLTVDLQQVDSSGLPLIGRKKETIVFELGSGFLGPDGDTRLAGMKTGEIRRLEIEEEGSELIETPGAGKSTWDVYLKSLEKVDLPELDDDFAAQVSEKYENVEQFREEMRRQLQLFAQYQANQRTAVRLREAVIGGYGFDLPPSLYHQTLEDMVHRQMHESGGGYDAEQLHRFFAPIAVQELQWFFIRRRLIEAEKLQATEEEIMQQVENYHGSHPDTNLEELKLLFKTGEKREQLTDEIVMGKVMDVLRQGVMWEDRPVAFMDLLRDAQTHHVEYGAGRHLHDHAHAQ